MGARMLLQIAVGLALLKVLHATAPTGQVFITAFMQNYKLDYSEAQFQLFISGHLPSTLVSVWICKLYQMSKLTIFRGQTAVVKIPTYLEMGGTAKLCKTVMVKSSGHVTVLAFSSKKNSADTMVVYPVNQLGVEYYVLTPLGEFPNTYKEFSVIAWEKQTKVEIHLKGKVSFRKKTYPAGSKLNVVLSPYEAIQLQSLEDLSGTFIKSEKPVAVLSGHTCAQKNTHCNHVMEQLLPVPIWGRVFIIPPLSFQMNFDLAYVVASQTTSLTCVSGGLHRNYNLVAGQVLQLKVTHSSPIYITANVGIQVFLFCTGGIHSHLNFDPYFISIPDTSRYCRHYSVKEQVNFENYVHIIAKTTAIGGITIDKHSLGVVSWRPIPGTEYSWSEYYLGEEGTSHELFDPVNHFGVLSFGLAERNAYGSAGLCKTDLQHFPPSSCRSIRCQKNHFCQMINDKPICMSSSTATCRAQGDPHYQTFDKRQYNFMGTCTYTMAKTCGPDATFPAFHITAKNEKRGTQSVSYVGLVMVQVYGYNISVARSEYGLVRVNNQRSRLPISLHDGRLRLYQRGTSVFVATDFSLWVSYDWNSQLLVKISRSFSEKICGLCGNYNGNPTDDFRTPSGSLALSPEEFGKSWKVEDGDKLCWSDCRGECSEVTTNMLKKYKAEPFCGWISKRKNGPFSQCHPLVDPKIFLENCAYDLYIYKGHQEVLCQALKSYADACQSEGATLSDWRRLTGCSLSCPENSQYMLCGSACPATCNNQALPPDCNSSQCMETCECNEGFVLDAGQCIPQAACGCLFEDRLLSPNEQFWGDSTCTRHCICDPRSRQVQCQPASCKDGQQCKVENGLQDCYPTDYAKCSAFGYSHYHSFDGQSFNFQGTCLYTLTGLSKKSQGLIDFQVLVQNAGQVGGPISLNKLVKVQVYGLEILVSWAYRGRVMVNGLLTNLPYKRGLDQILIYQKGWHAVIRTDFDVTITFDWQSHVTVTVPNTYKDALGGLCSNFNGHRQDDLISRDAMPAANPTALGQRWKVAESPGCRELNPKVCPDFQRVAQHQRSTSVECGVLVDKRGPFRGCHGTINPEVFFLDCVYDYCTYGGRQAVLVHVVAAYVAACQAMQVTIYAWRDHLLWKPTCLQNSHYELCTESCQQACSSLHWPLLCSTHCTEGCFCDKGFMLSGDRCVPMDQCGCMYQGQYYLAGETFFPTSKCNLECVCQVGGAVTCKEFSCGPYEECRVVDGTRKCHPVGLATCTAYGDPHYISFDGVRFDFQGTCTYILAKAVLTGKRDLTPFTVMQENETWKKKNVSVTKMVSVEAYGNTVALLQKKKGVVKVNGIFQSLPVVLSDGRLTAYQQGTNVLIKTEFGLLVSYNLVYRVTITIPSKYRGHVEGLCGNYNEQKKDEFLLQDGTLASDAAAFGAAWKVPVPGAEGSCSDGCSGSSCPVCEERKKAIFKQRNYCGILTASDGPFRACHSKVDPSVYFDNCIYDVCLGNGESLILCQSIQSYVSTCQEAGVSVEPWRNPSFCPLHCPANSHYQLCADLCSTSCAKITDPQPCPETCTEGCQCDDGFFFDGLGCVHAESCGCFHNGRYYKPNETVLLNNCQESCRCIPSQGVTCEAHSCARDETCKIQDGVLGCFHKDPCKALHCRQQETCKIENGLAKCVPNFNGSCWGWGDPHYHTFDGMDFDFQGTCSYTIAKYCGSDPTLVPFTIVEKNDNRGNQAVSYVSLANIFVYGYKISIYKQEVGRIRLNDAIFSLPLTLEEGKIRLFQSGPSAVLQTEFGLQVTYDWKWHLVITLPSSYYNAMCGLCGNFNRDPRDDMALPNGTMVSSVTSWASSWRVKDRDPFCWDSCQGNCPTCDESKKELYGSNAHCGIIRNASAGPFRECHAKVNPDDFFDSCIYDVCLNGGAQGFLCQALEAYAKTCRKAGALIYDWRTPSGCALQCPENSHYEFCGNACPASCSDRTAPSTCQEPCVETCQCDEGYVLSADKCVPTGSCGCTYNGFYYKPGEEFWAGGNCGSRCTCDSTLGIVVCKPASCQANEQCALVNGVWGCHPVSYATCSASGDLHYTSFDGRRYDFMGTCIYQLVGLCSDDPTLKPFTINVENNNRGNKKVSYTKVVTVEAYNLSIVLSQEHPRRIQVNGAFANLPFYHGDKIKAYLHGMEVFIQTDFDVTVVFDWKSYVRVMVPSTYTNAVCGLCGNNNRDPKDDFAMKDGSQAPSASQFAESWKVAEVPGCSVGCTDDCPACGDAQKEAYEGEQYCGILIKKDGPFRQCHGTIDPTPYFIDCVFDTCQYHGQHDALCRAISVYVAACQALGVQIGPWRTDSFCSPACWLNSHYELCGNGCPVTCHGLSAPAGCVASCKEGCYCDAGFVLSGDQCVPLGDCGCMHQGKYYKKGEYFYPSSSCQEQCQCTENGVVECQETSCGPHEECKVQDGIQGCHPVGCGNCRVAAGSHYLTFDGRAYDFHGTCLYALSTVAGKDSRLANFSVLVENDRSLTKSVVVSVHGYTVVIEKGMKWQVKVNGERYTLPMTTSAGRLWANQEGSNIIVQSDFGLKVLYDSSSYVLVFVPSTYQGHVGGLCGNFNKDKTDDFTLPSGESTQNVDQFGASWKVPLEGTGCSDGCGEKCPVCGSQQTAPYTPKSSCGMIQAMSGPFKGCHAFVDPAEYFGHCLYDMCASNGAMESLCRSLQAYVAACQAAGATIEAWRNSSFCPLTCPSNSHYSLCTRTCDFTCTSLSTSGQCTEKCFEGCQCDSSYLFDGNRCVAMEDCGCVYDGRYIKAGESLVLEGCLRKCTCRASGRLTCEDTSCQLGEICAIHDGVRGCRGPEGECALTPGARLVSFDGVSGEILHKGVYDVASLCNESDPFWFRIVAVVQECNDWDLPAVSTIHIFFQGGFITVRRNRETWINGHSMALPAKATDDVSVRLSEDGVVVELASKVKVLLWSTGKVLVQASGNLAGMLCASCGNFNGNSADDLQLPNGEIAGSISVVIEAWKSMDFSGW
ncbi:IgGFc-binding protein [Varanus komodoensis]|uniref:IgGFc-binding protein n=1 Tax=Varanus komodoensis TaxID=61221 RepID=UPI001CF7B55B|nr:IgGFc-binding protein [Varanus komodoensis]